MIDFNASVLPAGMSTAVHSGWIGRPATDPCSLRQSQSGQPYEIAAPVPLACILIQALPADSLELRLPSRKDRESIGPDGGTPMFQYPTRPRPVLDRSHHSALHDFHAGRAELECVQVGRSDSTFAESSIIGDCPQINDRLLSTPLNSVSSSACCRLVRASIRVSPFTMILASSGS